MLIEIFLFILGEHGFNAYCASGGGGANHEGTFIPSWENVGDRIRILWARSMGDTLLRRINGERDTDVLGRYAYERYSYYAGGVDRLNRPIPDWTSIDEKTRARWIASATRISEIAGAYVGHRCQEGMGNAKDVLSGVITLDNLYLVPGAVLGLENGPFRLLSLISTSTENLVSPGENHIGTTSIVRSVWSGMLRAGVFPDAALEALSAGVKTIADEREAQRQKARNESESLSKALVE